MVRTVWRRAVLTAPTGSTAIGGPASVPSIGVIPAGMESSVTKVRTLPVQSTQ